MDRRQFLAGAGAAAVAVSTSGASALVQSVPVTQIGVDLASGGDWTTKFVKQAVWRFTVVERKPDAALTDGGE